VKYILDTDIFTIATLPDSRDYLRLHARVLDLDDDDLIATTIITYEEQTRGWLAYAAKSRQTPHQIKAYARLRAHLRMYLGFEVLDFDQAAGAAYDRIRSLNLRVGAADLKIAAIAISQNAVLLSRNLKHFESVPGLRVEDWTRP
jgi:tRNA(fMet)-specific endonuclease VapC